METKKETSNAKYHYPCGSDPDYTVVAECGEVSAHDPAEFRQLCDEKIAEICAEYDIDESRVCYEDGGDYAASILSSPGELYLLRVYTGIGTLSSPMSCSFEVRRELPDDDTE